MNDEGNVRVVVLKGLLERRPCIPAVGADRVKERFDDDGVRVNGVIRVHEPIMDPRDPFRIEMTDMLLEKLYNMGVIPSRKSLALCDHLSVSSFCRRRLATILVRLKFAEHLKEAVTYIEQGHIRVGPETVTDPAFLVTRNMEDFITWVDTSKIKRKVLEYNDKVDDYDAMN
ncbi:S4 RNA-binding domain-containing protein [Citrus sinensis]|nr:S4 RNA-binding domain-containing protein [Citrus sinensis]